MPPWREADQPEGNRHAHEFVRPWVVGQDAQGLELRVRVRRVEELAVQDRIVIHSQLDERLATGEARTGIRELLLRVFARRELGVDVAIEEERRAADDGKREDSDDDHRGDQDRDPGFASPLFHPTYPTYLT